MYPPLWESSLSWNTIIRTSTTSGRTNDATVLGTRGTMLSDLEASVWCRCCPWIDTTLQLLRMCTLASWHGDGKKGKKGVWFKVKVENILVTSEYELLILPSSTRVTELSMGLPLGYQVRMSVWKSRGLSDCWLQLTNKKGDTAIMPWPFHSRATRFLRWTVKMSGPKELLEETTEKAIH